MAELVEPEESRPLSSISFHVVTTLLVGVGVGVGVGCGAFFQAMTPSLRSWVEVLPRVGKGAAVGAGVGLER